MNDWRRKKSKKLTHLNSEVWEIIVYSVRKCMIRCSRRHKESLYACQLKQMRFSAESKRTQIENNQPKMHIPHLTAVGSRCAFPFTQNHNSALCSVQLVLYLVGVRVCVHYNELEHIFDTYIVCSV